MKIATNRKASSASVLVISLCVALLLAITLSSYLLLIRHTHAMTYQSQAWNRALALAEAGVEEGLAQVNVSFGTNYFPSIRTNWFSLVPGYYGPKISRLENGFYSTIIIPRVPGPTIVSTGYTRVPYLDKPIARTVKVDTTSTAVFSYAMAAMENIFFKGNTIAIDSFDSTDPNYSTAGLYDPAKRKAGGDVASNFGMISVGNANINGKVYVGAGNGSAVSFGANGLVGDLTWTGPGIQPGWRISDFNMDFPDVVMPSTAGWLPPLGPMSTNKYVLASGGYMISGDLRLDEGQAMLVTGNAVLYVSGGVVMKGLGEGGSQILIEPGASLRVYVAGPSSTIARVNTAGNASSFQYFGLPSNQSISWSGNAAYTGTVYAPSAVFSLSGSGDPNDATDFQGSCVAKSVVMNGHFKFHYDEALKRTGPGLIFKVVSWNEL